MLVAISGTNSSSSDSIHVDLDFLLVPTDSRDFPGGDEAGVLLHKGFYEAFGRMRGEIGGVVLAGVGRGVREIHVVGHSLGELPSPHDSADQQGLLSRRLWGPICKF